MRKILIMLFIVLDIFYVFAQKKKSTYFDKATTITATARSDSILSMLDDYERIQLPPLSVFLESVYDHPSIRIYEAKREEANAEMKITKREWLSYFRVFGQYQYGRVIQLTSRETIDDPLSMASMGTNQHLYNAGVSLSIPLGDLFSRKQKVRAKKAHYRQLDYEYEISIEERKLKILQVYNEVLLAFNAQMKISEQDFINGKIDIIALSLERGRRSSAVVNYQEGQATLHNAITLLEMLTNVRIIQDK